MFPLGIAGAFLVLLMFFNLSNYQNAITDNQRSYVAFASGELRAYGGYIATYARTNAGYTGVVSDAMAAVPSWLNQPTSWVGYAQGGRAFIYFTPTTVAEGYAIARSCGGGLICGVTKGGLLYEPGKSAATAITLPGPVPDNGALVLVL